MLHFADKLAARSYKLGGTGHRMNATFLSGGQPSGPRGMFGSWLLLVWGRLFQVQAGSLHACPV
jgi:hypothetical protein